MAVVPHEMPAAAGEPDLAVVPGREPAAAGAPAAAAVPGGAVVPGGGPAAIGGPAAAPGGPGIATSTLAYLCTLEPDSGGERWVKMTAYGW